MHVPVCIPSANVHARDPAPNIMVVYRRVSERMCLVCVCFCFQNLTKFYYSLVFGQGIFKYAVDTL